MKKVCMLGLVLLVLGRLALAQDKVFDWVRASDEVSQLDPADYHAGRVYHPSADGGSMHVDIQARQPVTIAMAFASDWDAWQQHPESQAAPEFRCTREHVTSTTYECHMPPNRPMVLLIRDERTSDRAVLTGIGAVLGRGARQFISPNDVKVTYYSWTCVQNCIQPEFQWFSLVKEKYELTSVPKIYSLLTPERDGQQVNVRIKAPVPMTIALLPSELADQVYDNPATLSSALSKTSCKQRGVQSLSFDCTVNLADGRQSLVVVPDGAKVPHKKAEVQLQTVKCAANCDLLNK
ncbi:MAG: hypothetical protein ACXVZH_11400 [Terriglobales bacterium]